MGRRDDRLHTPEAFQQALMSRPVSRQGPFAVYRIAASEGQRIGFVIPKKLVKNAVQRNQIKRWARAIFRQPNQRWAETFAMVLRVNQALPASDWVSRGRDLARKDLGVALLKALSGLAVDRP